MLYIVQNLLTIYIMLSYTAVNLHFIFLMPVTVNSYAATQQEHPKPPQMVQKPDTQKPTPHQGTNVLMYHQSPHIRTPDHPRQLQHSLPSYKTQILLIFTTIFTNNIFLVSYTAHSQSVPESEHPNTYKNHPTPTG